jgi:hypothetical protein
LSDGTPIIAAVTHTFLLEAGRWTLVGHWMEQNQAPVTIKGKTLVAWSQDSWFSMVTKLIFPSQPSLDLEPKPAITMQYRGRLEAQDLRYTFVLQHSQLGQVEGEGWLAPDSIVQRFWALSDGRRPVGDHRGRRHGFETIYRMNADCYHLTSGVMAGHTLINTMEAKLERQRG